jgi:predicted ribonuclease toxin of YeeF-YezG toxin-antitoxin module
VVFFFFASSAKPKAKGKHASKSLQEAKKKVEIEQRNALPHAAACTKNGEPESNTWKARSDETRLRSQAGAAEKRIRRYRTP